MTQHYRPTAETPPAKTTSVRTLVMRGLRGLLRLYCRPGWVEHGKHSASMPGGIYIANFSSWIDPLLLMAMLDEEFAESQPDFALVINLRHRKHRWARLAAALGNVMYFDPAHHDAECNSELADAIRSGRTLIILPEGRPTDTGALLPVCDTLAALLAESDPLLHPVYIAGGERSVFSQVWPRQCRTALLPRFTLHLFPAVRLSLPAASKGRARTQQAATQLYDLLSQTAFEQYDYHCTLFRGILRAMRRHGGSHIIAEDVERNSLSYRKLVAGSYVLGQAIIRRLRDDEQNVGLMLPNVNAALVTFCGLQAFGRTPALLNFTAGRRNICSAAKTAAIRTVITSRRFVQLSEMEKTINALREQGLNLLYLEDLRNSIGVLDKLRGLGMALAGFRGYEKLHRDSTRAFESESPAVILFTSGSESAPKGVALSHENLIANIAQLQARIDVGAADCIFNPLPMFHTSGLTGGYILPLLSGMKMFLYPSPLHYQQIPELIADTQATVLFATDTFLNGYARYAHPYHLHRLRYVFAGAEKLREETRRIWAERFGVRVFEGYGVTETAPVLAFNTPMYNRVGTVGRFAPGILYRLTEVEGITEGGRLSVQGPNIMMGYLLPENPGILVPPHDTQLDGSDGTPNRWHDTGDIVSIDEDGFARIIGRAKRFAKIGGEMVSLAGVEQRLGELWPDSDHAVVTQPDSRKGEHLVLLTTQPDADRSDIVHWFREQGLPELHVPRIVLHTEELPLLGSGKIDYPAVQAYVDEVTASKAA